MRIHLGDVRLPAPIARRGGVDQGAVVGRGSDGATVTSSATLDCDLGDLDLQLAVEAFQVGAQPRPQATGAGLDRQQIQDELEFLPDPASILEEIVPVSFKVRLFKCFLDAAVSEQIGRMIAMRGATENADEIKIRYACALTQLASAGETIKVPSVGDRPARERAAPGRRFEICE